MTWYWTICLLFSDFLVFVLFLINTASHLVPQPAHEYGAVGAQHTYWVSTILLSWEPICMYIYICNAVYIYICNDIYIYICAMIYIYICNESKNVRTTKTCGKMRHPIVPRGAVTCAGAIRLSYQVVVLILTVFINQSIQQLGRITTCSLWHLPWITVWVLAAHYTKPYRELSNHTDTHGRSTVRRFHSGELPPHGTRDKEGRAVDATARGKPNLYTYSISAHTVL